MNKDQFRKKFLFPLCYVLVLGIAIASANHMIGGFSKAVTAGNISAIEPAAGGETSAAVPVPPVDEKLLKDAPIVPALDDTDASEEAPLTISPDKPDILHLSRDAVNVLVGSPETLRAIPDTNRTVILIPNKPGATYFKAIDSDGHVIMQRHVIVGAPASKSKYIRVRRACVNGAKDCKEFSIYYCPDVCHEVNVTQDTKGPASTVPTDAPSSPTNNEDAAQGNPNSENVTPPTPTPTTTPQH